MTIGENIGQPWLHKGVKCAKCEVSPISGYRYKCKKRPDYDLCQACFRREIPDPKIKYLKIERAKTTGPYQVHLIECAECGVAPIKGKRYRHKTQEDCDMCEACFLRATNPSNRRAQPESDYELFEELVINSVCTKYDPVFHFDKRCNECLVSPICGPTFTSIKNPDYDLCAFCHDEKLQSDSIRLGDFVSREKPDVSAVYHLNIICCVHCGTTPIKGPAFKHRRDPNKTLCLICYHHVNEDKQRYFTRIDPPRQAEKGGPKFPLQPKASTQVQASATKTAAVKTSTEAPISDAGSNTSGTNAKSDSVSGQGANSTTSPDPNEGGGGGVASRGYGARSNISSNGTTPVASGPAPSSRISSRTAVDSGTKTPPPALYTAGPRTARAPSPKLRSPPSPQPGQSAQPLQSALKFPSSAPAAPKPKVTFAEPEQQPPPSVKFSPSLQPPPAQQRELNRSSPPRSQQMVYPPPPLLEELNESSPPQSQQRVYPPPPLQAELNKSSPPQSQQRVYPPPPAQPYNPQYQQPAAAAAQSQGVLGSSSAPSSQSQAGGAVPPPYMPGAAPSYPPSAADYLAAMTAAQNNSAQQALAMLSAIRIEKERSNLALMQQILQRTQQQQQGVDYSALLGYNGGGGGGIDYSALLNKGEGSADYSSLLAGAAGGGGIDYSALIAAAGGSNGDLAALLAGQNNLGGLAGVISNLGGLGLG